MNSKRLYYLLVCSLVLLFGLSFAAVYLGKNTLVEKNTNLSNLKARSSALEAQERSLVQAEKDIEEYDELEVVAKAIVPQEKDQAKTVRELVAIAEETGISIANITFPSSNLGDEAKTKKSNGVVSQVEPVEGVPGLFQLDVDVAAASEVEFNTLVSFLENLESNRRTSTISSITITPSANEAQQTLSFGLRIKVFIKP